jgi:PKD repeat protein/uncharacterized protein YfaP (DUF2135 family)
MWNQLFYLWVTQINYHMKKLYLLVFILLFSTTLLPAQNLKKVTGKAIKQVELPNQVTPQPIVENLSDINDGFEGYSDFSLTFAPWTTVDVDQSETYGFESNTFPNMYSPMAFVVFNPASTSPVITDPDLQAHTGSKFAACFASTTPPNNDWLISPAITLGTNSSVSFWVKTFTDLYGLERYKVGISTTNTDPGSFTIISGANYLEAPITWQQKVYDLNAYNGQTVYIGIQCVSNDAFVFMVDDFIATTTISETTNLAGNVSDAFTGSPIPGAIVTLGSLSTTTDSNGDYLIPNVPLGSLTAAFSSSETQGEAPLVVHFFDQSTEGTNTVTCSKAGYITYSNNQVVIPPGTTFTLNISLSPTLTDEAMRFVLNWGATPLDLDSHLDTPIIEGQEYHVYYSDQGNATAAPYAALDHDVTSGYGPETMTIYQMFDGTYKFYIYNYSGSPEITTSQAVVQIYNQAGLMQTVQVPTSGTGRYWYVCDVNGNTGQLTIRNTVQETSPGLGKFDMPAKTPAKNGKEIISWLWNFGDGTTSTQQNPSHTYTSAGTYNVTLTVNNGSTSDSETKTAYIIVTGATGSGTLSGLVTDALNGNPVEGALVSIGGLTDLTDVSGNYLIENVPIGALTAAFSSDVTQGEAPLAVNFFDQSTEGTNLVTCSKTGYNTYSNNQVVIPPGSTFTLNISLSPTLTDAEMRFVLNWGATPLDLDSHLDTPIIEGQEYHVYYSDQGNATAAPYAALDHDVTSGYGPETMTIYQIFDGTYKFYIYNYSGSPEITTSQAVVQIYNQAGLLQTVQVPTSGTGSYWYVCDVNGVNGQLTIRNTVQEQSPGLGKSDMPAKVIPKNADAIISWLWDFGDGGTSNLQNPSHTYIAAGAYTVKLTVNNGTTTDIETKTAYINVSETVGSGTLTGLVTDAINGNPVEGALVTIGGLTDLTDASGNYVIENIPAGILSSNFNASQTIGLAPLSVQFFDQSTENSNTVTCSKTGYSSYSNNQVIVPQGGTLNLNISLSPALSGGQMRFVLNWSASPGDLDSHLRTPPIESVSYHISYENQGDATNPPYATLDYDVTSGYGPETITIYEKYTGTYQYYIHNYDETPDITTSQAVVQIYNDNGLLQTLQVPTSGTGLYWYVCDINGANGQISIRNVIQENEPGATKSVLQPKKVKKEALRMRNINSWSWNFGDGGTSTQQNPVYSYTTPGTYNVSLTVGNGISNDTETKTAFIIVQSVGVSESGIAEKIRLYPVPVSDILTIDSPVEISSIRITDLSGKIVLENSCSGSKISVGLNDLTRGVYLIYLTTTSEDVIKKFTVN